MVAGKGTGLEREGQARSGPGDETEMDSGPVLGEPDRFIPSLVLVSARRIAAVRPSRIAGDRAAGPDRAGTDALRTRAARLPSPHFTHRFSVGRGDVGAACAGVAAAVGNLVEGLFPVTDDREQLVVSVVVGPERRGRLRPVLDHGFVLRSADKARAHGASIRDRAAGWVVPIATTKRFSRGHGNTVPGTSRGGPLPKPRPARLSKVPPARHARRPSRRFRPCSVNRRRRLARAGREDVARWS
jgi:hypothetical protein